MSDDLPIQSSGPGLVERAKSILTQPNAEWPRIAGETTEPMRVLTTYAIPLAAIGPISALIGGQLFGYNVLFTTVRPSLGFSIGTAVTSFVLSLVSLFVVAFVANFLSPKFGGKDSFPAAFRLVAYAMTAAWIGGIFGLVPSLALIGLLFGLYSLYLFYLGAAPVMGVPADKSLTYTVLTVIAAIVVNIVVAAVAAAITGAFGGATGALAANQLAETTMDLGELGTVTVDGENSTVDLGELGRVEMNGDTATLTVDGEEVEVDMAAVQAAAERAAAEAEARTAE